MIEFGSISWFYSEMDDLMCQYAHAIIDYAELSNEIITLCKEVIKFYGTSEENAREE